MTTDADATPLWPRPLATAAAAPRRALVVALMLAVLLAGLQSPASAALSPAVFCEVPGVGVLRGTTQRSADNAPFAAFEGVPYAKPPLGALRFKPAEPADSAAPATFIKATSQTMPCPYLTDKNVLVGVEDCLYLSVYTPEVDADRGLPVLVMLPGDDWTRGYAGRWKPHRLVDRGVVVVTVQSRLGALGFLTTGDAAAPGNLGLKDERLALSWVQKNIKAFGGDPGNVTVAGVGAGAAAAMLHAVSSTGLLQRVVAVSGSALSPWSLTENTQAAVDAPTRRLAEAVGCDCPVPVPGPGGNASANATTATPSSAAASAAAATANATASTATRPANMTDMLECLRSRSVADVVYGTARLQGWAGLPPSPFGPVVERHGLGAEAFLADAPHSLWGRVRVPMLVGLARSEGLQTLASWPTGGLLNSSSQLAELDADWARLAPLLLAFNATPEADKKAAADEARRRYLGVGTPADAKDGLLRLFADRHVVVPAVRAALAHAAAKQPVFVYRFGWSAALGGSALAGPAGGSDATLLLMQPSATEAARLPAQRAMAADIMDVWVSFMRNGTPSVGNTTLQAVAARQGAVDDVPDLAVLELTRPGVHSQGSWPVRDMLSFWSGLPLLENAKPTSEAAAAAGQLDPHGAQRSASSSGWQHCSLPLHLLAALLYFILLI